MADLDNVVRGHKERKTARREFLVRLGSAGLGIGAGTLIAGCGGGGGSFAAGAGGGPISEAAIKSAFLDIQKDENDHVTFLASALGAAARPRPTFDPKLLTVPDEQTLWHIASALENTGPGAYLDAVSHLAAAYVPAAASIAIVEGRHAGFLNILSGKGMLLTSPNSLVGAGKDAYGLPTGLDSQGPPQMGNGSALTPGDPAGFAKSQEIPQPPTQVMARAAGFLGTVNPGNAPADNTGSGTTYLNGGPGFPSNDYSTTTPAFAPQTGNTSLIILNYALFLEYLERDFYNINVTKFYGGGPAYSQTGA